MFGNPVSQALADSNIAQPLAAQVYLDKARLEKTAQHLEVALTLYDHAKIAFKNIANARQLTPPLSEVKSALIQARMPDTPEEKALRRRIAEVYFERAELLKELGKTDKAQASYKKAKDWGYEEINSTSIPPAVMLSVHGMLELAQVISTASMPVQQLPLISLTQEKSALMDYFFEKALSTLGSLELPNIPDLFLVYAHDNPAHGQADANTSKYLIDKLSKICVNLYSDQTPMGQPYSNSTENLKEDGTLADILASQLRLLPTQLRDDVKPADKVVVCCSEVLGSYLKWAHYGDFYHALKKAYHQDRYQRGESVIRKVVAEFSHEPGFHHVLTEMAFLQIREEQLKDQHGIIPVSLTRNSFKECLGHFISPTVVRIEDISRFYEQPKAKREAYPNQNRHLVLFKLIERLLVGGHEAKTFLNKLWQGYNDCISRLKDDATLDELEFVKIVDSIFDSIRIKLHSQLASAIQQTRNLLSIDLRKALYQYYQPNLSIQRVSGENASLDDCYVNLAIIDSHAQREKDQVTLKKQASTFERLPSDEQLQATNYSKSISLDNLFDSQKLHDGSIEFPKRILIQGRAGIGKTTLCKKLVYEYHRNGLWQDKFTCVLWVPLRQLKTHAPARLEDLLCNQYFAGYKSSQAQALSKGFYARQDKTLFILDGLDEIVGELNEGRPLKDFLQALLNQTHVVITSRPAGVDTKLLGQLDLELEMVGFSPNNVQTYIEKFMPASNQAVIQQFINRTPLIQGLVNIPIQLDALCYSWDQLPQNQEVTMSMLYQAMVDKLWRKDGARLEKQVQGNIVAPNIIQISSKAKLEKLMADEIHYFGYLALKGLEEGKIEFNLDELDQRQAELEDRFLGKALSFSFTENLKKTSFLHTADAERPKSERYYHFLHLTFQEFFAAKFLVKHLQAYEKVESASVLSHFVPKGLDAMPSRNVLEAFIATHKYNPRYEIVWWMVAGLLKDVALENFFASLEQSPRDLIGGRHYQVIMGCLNEARSQLNKTTVSRLEEELMQCLQLEIKLSEDGWSELSRQKAFPEHLLLTWLHQPAVEKSNIIRILGARPVLSMSAISALIDALKDPEWNVRSAAASALGGQATLSEDALNALASTLCDENEVIRWVAANALGSQATLSEIALNALIDVSRDKNEIVRLAAVNALNGQATRSKTALQALISALQDENTSVKSGAASALGGKKMLPEAALSALISALKDSEWNVRDAAARVLGGQETLSEDALQALIRAQQDENTYVRYTASSTLSDQVTLPEAALQALIGALRDENASVRSWAAKVLRGQKTLPETALQALISTLQDENTSVKFAAASALEGQKILPEAAFDALIRALQASEWNVGSAAARALGGQVTLPEGARQTLVGALKDEDGYVRAAAAKALGGQITLAEDVLQALIGALKDDNEYVRSAAANALGGQITLAEDALQTLIGTLKDENEYVRSAAANALEGQVKLPEAAIQALVSALQDENASVRPWAAKVLRGQVTLSETALQALIGAPQDPGQNIMDAPASVLDDQVMQPEATILVLISALQDEKTSVRFWAARVLGSQKTLPEAAIHSLIGTLHDPEWDVSDAAASTLEGQATLSNAALQALIDTLQNENASTRYAAARALGSQVKQSGVALEALISALEDENEYVRDAAASALGGQATLSETALEALISALQDEDEDIRVAVASALSGQTTLSEEVLQALIDSLQDDNVSVRDATAQALKLNLNQLYRMLPTLEVEQIQTLYKRFLFGYSCAHIAPLYVQGNGLYFHSEAGFGQVIHLTSEQKAGVIRAFSAAKAEAGISSLSEKELF